MQLEQEADGKGMIVAEIAAPGVVLLAATIAAGVAWGAGGKQRNLRRLSPGSLAGILSGALAPLWCLLGWLAGILVEGCGQSRARECRSGTGGGACSGSGMCSSSDGSSADGSGSLLHRQLLPPGSPSPRSSLSSGQGEQTSSPGTPSALGPMDGQALLLPLLPALGELWSIPYAELCQVPMVKIGEGSYSKWGGCCSLAGQRCCGAPSP